MKEEAESKDEFEGMMEDELWGLLMEMMDEEMYGDEKQGKMERLSLQEGDKDVWRGCLAC